MCSKIRIPALKIKELIMRNQKYEPIGGIFLLLLVLINAVALKQGFTGNSKWYLIMILTLPLLIVAIKDSWQEYLKEKQTQIGLPQNQAS